MARRLNADDDDEPLEFAAIQTAKMESRPFWDPPGWLRVSSAPCAPSEPALTVLSVTGALEPPPPRPAIPKGEPVPSETARSRLPFQPQLSVRELRAVGASPVDRERPPRPATRGREVRRERSAPSQGGLRRGARQGTATPSARLSRKAARLRPFSGSAVPFPSVATSPREFESRRPLFCPCPPVAGCGLGRPLGKGGGESGVTTVSLVRCGVLGGCGEGGRGCREQVWSTVCV